MRIAILGATSQLARDLIEGFATATDYSLSLFARRPVEVEQWLEALQLGGRFTVADYPEFRHTEHYDALLNFVGIGDPGKAAAMGRSIFEVTMAYDDLALDYLRVHPECRYIFLSSGAAYGSSFDEPVGQTSRAEVAINALAASDYYAVAKLYAECRHRAQAECAIIDIRVFNYISRSLDLNGKFLLSDIARSLVQGRPLQTSAANITRDFLHRDDFLQLVVSLLESSPVNDVVDCYSQAPIDKLSLLQALQERYGLMYQFPKEFATINATGSKPYYYSTNRRAARYGYQPSRDSLSGIIEEFDALLEQRVGALHGGQPH